MGAPVTRSDLYCGGNSPTAARCDGPVCGRSKLEGSDAALWDIVYISPVTNCQHGRYEKDVFLQRASLMSCELLLPFAGVQFRSAGGVGGSALHSPAFYMAFLQQKRGYV
jgi:hypothetical protein